MACRLAQKIIIVTIIAASSSLSLLPSESQSSYAPSSLCPGYLSSQRSADSAQCNPAESAHVCTHYIIDSQMHHSRRRIVMHARHRPSSPIIAIFMLIFIRSHFDSIRVVSHPSFFFHTESNGHTAANGCRKAGSGLESGTEGCIRNGCISPVNVW